MPALGAPELIIILVIIILIFGVGKLPEVGQALGKGIREFRSATEEADKKEPEPPSKPAASVEAETKAPAIAAPATPPTELFAYTIQSGDTVESVAQRHGVTVDALMRANGWSQRDRVLYPGDKLQIPRTPAGAS